MESRLIAVFVRVMEVPRDSVSLDASPSSVPTWDSLRHMHLLLAVEQEFRVTFYEDELMATPDLRSIAEILKRHGVS